MSSLLEKEIERAIDGRLAPASARSTEAPAAPAPAPSARRAPAPVVRFSPMFEEPNQAVRRRRRSLIAWSIAAHVLLVVTIILMPKRVLSIVEPALPIQIVFSTPIPPVVETMRPPAAPKPIVKPKPKPELRPEPPPPVVEAPKPLPKPVIPEVVAPPAAKAEPPRPRPVVRTGLLDEAPASPAILAGKSSRSVIVASGFEGSGMVASSSSGRPGRVVEAAFDSGPATGSGKRTRAAAGTVQESGFGEEAAAAPKKRERERSTLDLDTEVEILSKPRPVYTEEARSLRIEGDVVLDVTFLASGLLRVLSVSAGLGHGLDEAAIDAAKKIQFNPAKRDGTPVDHTAKLSVVFRLA